MKSVAPKVLIFSSNYVYSRGLQTLIQQSGVFEPIVVQSNEVQKQIEQCKPTGLVMEVKGDIAHNFQPINQNKSIASLAITSHTDKSKIDELLKEGFLSIISTDCHRDDLMNAVRSLRNNKRYLCSKIIDLLFTNDEKQQKANEISLTPREIEVLQLIADGLKTRQIADQLHVSVHTINSHRKNMLRKLGLKSPIELIVFAIENQLIKK